MAESDRRKFLKRATAVSSAFLLGGCYDLSQTTWWPKVLGSAEGVTKAAQRLFAGRSALAPEYPGGAATTMPLNLRPQRRQR